MEYNMHYKKMLDELRGKTIGLVYFFEKEDALGGTHYWIWKSDIISGWLNAIQELECVPYIMDVRTFIQKASYNTLPHIDFIINLNCGNYELSSLSLVPSMCSFLAIPCIPCDAQAIVTSENKHISNVIATANNINVPEYLPSTNPNGIFRPINLGSSIGIQIGGSSNASGLYQKFISGYDITIPIVYNPLIDTLDLLPPLLYYPNSQDPNWIYSFEEKYAEEENFIKCPMLNVDTIAKETLLNFAKEFPITTYGRIDGCIKCKNNTLSKDVLQNPLSLDDFYFVEINSMPTIELNDSFDMAFKTALSYNKCSMHRPVKQYCKIVKHASMIGYVLSSSIIALTKAKFQNQTDSNHN